MKLNVIAETMTFDNQNNNFIKIEQLNHLGYVFRGKENKRYLLKLTLIEQ